MNNLQAHPMSGFGIVPRGLLGSPDFGCPPGDMVTSGMGDIFSDAWGAITDGAEREIDRIISDAPQQIINAVTGEVAALPQVQAAAIQVAERTAVEQAINQYEIMKSQLKSQLASLEQKTGISPTILMVGGVAGAGLLVFFMMRR